MKLSQWLDQERGRATAMAEHFKISRSAVSQWRTDGVPVGLMKSVRDYTLEAVTLEEMLPDARENAAGPAQA